MTIAVSALQPSMGLDSCSNLSSVSLGALGERKPAVGHFDEKGFMCRSVGCLRQSNAFGGVVA
jgi:hypothetical protein